jgi:divalent anion:Na+ symporter, DASS family
VQCLNLKESHNEKQIYKGANLVPLLLALLVGAIIWNLAHPATVEPRGWHLFAVFVSLIVAIVGKALSMGALSLIAITFLISSHTLTVKEALSGFDQPIVWLVVSAFLLARSFIKTGLGTRLAYIFIGLLGQRTLGLGYGVAATELVLAPAIPSNTARAGGIIFPIVKALSVNFGSTPEKHSQRLIGGFLILTAYYCNLITSAMFLTGMAANPIMTSFVAEKGVHISWGLWALAALVPGVISLAVIPFIVYKLYPPEIKNTPEARNIAKKHLHEMGKITIYEWITLAVFLLLGFLWILGESLAGLDSTAVALIGVSILILTGVLTWNDIKKEHEAWDALIWFSILIMMASFLNQFGVIHAFTNNIHNSLNGLSWTIAFPILLFLYFYSHYFFASNTAHVTSMFPAFFAIGLLLGTPPYLLAFSLAYSSNLFACITHYGTGCAPILYGSEYVNLKTWWKMGALVSVIFLFIWIGLGACWWKLLGLW